MCTAATYSSKDHYFGRNFDYEISYDEEVVIVPRNFQLDFKHEDSFKTHNAITGIASGIVKEYPLIYDALNEKGLAMGGLNFENYAVYSDEVKPGKVNLAQYEFVPYVLGSCDSLDDVRKLLENVNITNESYSSKLPTSELHWMIADKTGKSIVVESTKYGVEVYDNPVGILTNAPRFDMQTFNLNNYLKASNKQPTNSLDKDFTSFEYSRGMGGMGLPGDYSSMSRFVKAVFVRGNSISKEDEVSSVSQFFHILGSVEQPKGSTFVREPDFYEYTIYSSCMNLDKAIYYYKTYDDFTISSVELLNQDLESSQLKFSKISQ